MPQQIADEEKKAVAEFPVSKAGRLLWEQMQARYKKEREELMVVFAEDAKIPDGMVVDLDIARLVFKQVVDEPKTLTDTP